MAKPKRKGRAYNVRKHARRHVVGMRIKWSDRTPLLDTVDIYDMSVTHKNPMLAPIAMTLFNGLKRWICLEQRFSWHVVIRVVFELDAIEYPLESHCIMDEIADLSQDLIAKARIEAELDGEKHGQYSHTEFDCAIVDF